MPIPNRAFGALIQAIYEAGDGERTLGALFEAFLTPFAAASAGVSIYDDQNADIAHTIAVPGGGGDLAIQEALASLYRDPGAQLLVRRRLRRAKRFTDIVAAPRLRTSPWFRLQVDLSGLSYGIVTDLEVDDRRVRLFVLRKRDECDFSADEVDLLDLIGPHFSRAFRGRVDRLTPARQTGEATAIVYESSASRLRRGRKTDRFAQRFALTAAEARVARAIAQGRSRQATADVLGIGLNTLRTHLRRIYLKSGSRRVSELVFKMRDFDR